MKEARSAKRSHGTEEVVGGCNEDVGEEDAQGKARRVVVVGLRRK